MEDKANAFKLQSTQNQAPMSNFRSTFYNAIKSLK